MILTWSEFKAVVVFILRLARVILRLVCELLQFAVILAVNGAGDDCGGVLGGVGSVGRCVGLWMGSMLTRILCLWPEHITFCWGDVSPDFSLHPGFLDSLAIRGAELSSKNRRRVINDRSSWRFQGTWLVTVVKYFVVKQFLGCWLFSKMFDHNPWIDRHSFQTVHYYCADTLTRWSFELWSSLDEKLSNQLFRSRDILQNRFYHRQSNNYFH